MKKWMILLLMAVLMSAALGVYAQDEPVVAEPGQEVDMVLLPKFLGILVFDQANEGAMEAHEELENPGSLEFVGPGPGEGADAQVPFITNAVTQGVGAIMISNNGGEVTEPAAIAALEAGIPVVSWDSPITPDGESVFIAQVDFDETGQVMADMALKLLGEDGGTFAILSATPDATNQNQWIEAMQAVLVDNPDVYGNLELVGIVYGNDQSEDSYNEALGLIDQGVELIMAPTTVGIAAAAKAVQDEGLCGEVLVSGLGLPAEMQGFVEAGCAQDFALWSFVDLGYLSYYTAYLLATGAIEGEVGDTFEAGRMGEYTIEEDPTREGGKRVLMGPFSVFTLDNIEEWAVAMEE
jgi:rhamnose transport system substrate-binding protein